MKLIHVYLLILIAITTINSHELHYTEKEIRNAVNQQKIHYNSAVRLQNVRYPYL